MVISSLMFLQYNVYIHNMYTSVNNEHSSKTEKIQYCIIVCQSWRAIWVSVCEQGGVLYNMVTISRDIRSGWGSDIPIMHNSIGLRIHTIYRLDMTRIMHLDTFRWGHCFIPCGDPFKAIHVGVMLLSLLCYQLISCNKLRNKTILYYK